MGLVQREKAMNILKKYSIKPRKGLGQNFLINEEVLGMIMENADINPGNLVVEVGPGIGTLTEALAKSACRIVAIEIDENMIQILKDTLGSFDNVTVIQQDFLETNLQELFLKYRPSSDSRYQIIANLPYYISTPIIQKIVANRKHLFNAVIMLQKEVAERIAANPGGKEYGSLSVAVQYFMHAEIVGYAPKDAFIPVPNVESAILKLTPFDHKKVDVEDEEFFFRVVHDAFRQRRKTLYNNLKQSGSLTDLHPDKIQAALRTAGIDGKRRGETLSIEEFARLANELHVIITRVNLPPNEVDE